MARTKRMAVIGAGITGLAAAFRLASRCPHIHATVFEASSRTGGIIQTIRRDGYLVELGPDSFITNKSGAVELCQQIGFMDQLIPTDETWRRSLVLRNGRPQPVPDGFMLMAPAKPLAILTTPILSPLGKLRLLSEALIPPSKTTDDESLANFVRRRFGKETLDRLVQPLVGGIYTSDPEKLSLQATLPRFSQMEQQYGSVIRGTLAGQKKADTASESSGSGARYGLFLTARDGLSSMVEAVENACRSTGQVSFRLNEAVDQISQNKNSATLADGEESIAHNCPWHVSFKNQQPEDFDGVIITLPTHRAAMLLAGPDFDSLRSSLNSIEYASSAIVVSGHRISDFTHTLDAFGLVIPDKEQRRILAVSFTSRKFPGRAPDGQILLRTFVGGAMQPHLMNLTDDEIVHTVRNELRDILGMKSPPIFEQVARYSQAMPQYHVGHMQRVKQLEAYAGAFTGLQLAGSAYHGVGIPDSISSGNAAADQLIQELFA